MAFEYALRKLVTTISHMTGYAADIQTLEEQAIKADQIFDILSTCKYQAYIQAQVFCPAGLSFFTDLDLQTAARQAYMEIYGTRPRPNYAVEK